LDEDSARSRAWIKLANPLCGLESVAALVEDEDQVSFGIRFACTGFLGLVLSPISATEK
jgi:hypothetical protein